MFCKYIHTFKVFQVYFRWLEINIYLYKIITEFIIAVCHWVFSYKISIKRINNNFKYDCGDFGKGYALQNAWHKKQRQYQGV